MPLAIRLWAENGDGGLVELRQGSLPSEQQLEEWIQRDVAILSDDLLIIGRQLNSPLGGTLDLLCIDGAGDLVIVELKKGQTPRDVVAQALHYAAWVGRLKREEIEDIAQSYLGRDLDAAFRERFEEPLPDDLNQSHRTVIVAAELDAVSETITKYLSEQWSVDINVMYFSCFQDAAGKMVLGRSWLMEPDQVEKRTSNGPKRRPKRSFEDLVQVSEQSGVRAVFEVLQKDLAPLTTALDTTRNNVTFLGSIDGSHLALISAYPGQSSSVEVGLRCDIRPARIASFLGIEEERVRAALPPESEPDGYYLYDELYHLKSVDAVGRLVGLFRQARGG